MTQLGLCGALVNGYWRSLGNLETGVWYDIDDYLPWERVEALDVPLPSIRATPPAEPGETSRPDLTVSGQRPAPTRCGS